MLGAGEFFGELSLLSGAPRTATATACAETTLLAISRDVFKMMVQDDIEIVFEMMKEEGTRVSDSHRPLLELSQRLDAVRVAAWGLQRIRHQNDVLPVTIDVAGLGAALILSPEAVLDSVGDLVAHGAGWLEDGRWTIGERAHVDRLLDRISCGRPPRDPEPRRRRRSPAARARAQASCLRKRARLSSVNPTMKAASDDEVARQVGDAGPFQGEAADGVDEVGHRQAPGHRLQPSGNGLDREHEARHQHRRHDDEHRHEVRLQLRLRQGRDQGAERQQRQDEEDRQQRDRHRGAGERQVEDEPGEHRDDDEVEQRR